MAAAQLKRTRREVLGAAMALPVAVVAGTSPALCAGPSTALRAVPLPHRCGGGSKWDALAAALEQALAAVREAERRSAGLSFAEAEAFQDEYDRRCSAFERALRRLLRAPAPDVAAFGEKVVLAIDHDVATLAGWEACLAALRRDALQIIGQRTTLTEV